MLWQHMERRGGGDRGRRNRQSATWARNVDSCADYPPTLACLFKIAVDDTHFIPRSKIGTCEGTGEW